MEALKAKDILTGRKVDSDRNCVLKAEMAKKNLHIKRSGLSSLGLATGVSTTFGLDTPGSGALNFPPTQQPTTASHALASQTKPNSTIPTSSSSTSLHVQQPPRTSGLTNNMLASANRPENLRISAAARTFNPFNDSPLASAPILGANSAHRSFSNAAVAAAATGAGAGAGGGHQYVSAFSNDNSVGERNSQMMAAPPGTAGVMGSFMYGNEQMNGNSGLHHRRGSFHGSTPNEATANAQQSLSDSTVVAADNAEDYQTQQQPQQKQRPAVLDIAALQPRLNQLGLGQMSATNMMSPMGGGASAMPYSAAPMLSTPVGMVLPMATTRSVNSNDQNPPCNTLYVGNLPVGAKEEELRLFFQAAMGYKRMSFKAKPNSGPMCFVEFESIDFATLAMSDLDGRMLSNSAGGGIRLSYSKNPLGVRSQNNPNSAAAAVLSSAAIAAAAAAMAGGYHQGANGGTAHYGYPMSALQTPSNPPATTRQDTSPSPPTQSGQLNRGPGMTPSLHHQHQSISSSTGTSPIPSPNTAVHGSGGEVPKDALSFLHQPIHRLHKQATSSETISTSSPGTTSTPPLTQ